MLQPRGHTSYVYRSWFPTFLFTETGGSTGRYMYSDQRHLIFQDQGSHLYGRGFPFRSQGNLKFDDPTWFREVQRVLFSVLPFRPKGVEPSSRTKTRSSPSFRRVTLLPSYTTRGSTGWSHREVRRNELKLSLAYVRRRCRTLPV